MYGENIGLVYVIVEFVGHSFIYQSASQYLKLVYITPPTTHTQFVVTDSNILDKDSCLLVLQSCHSPLWCRQLQSAWLDLITLSDPTRSSCVNIVVCYNQCSHSRKHIYGAGVA